MIIPPELLVENINGYSSEGSSKKEAFHRAGKTFLRRLAKTLNLENGTFEVRSNLGGMAGSGEITLHGEFIYIQLGESITSRGVGVLYRSCKGRKDYSGGTNHHTTTEKLQDPLFQAKFIEQCQKMALGPILAEIHREKSILSQELPASHPSKTNNRL